MVEIVVDLSADFAAFGFDVVVVEEMVGLVVKLAEFFYKRYPAEATVKTC